MWYYFEFQNKTHSIYYQICDMGEFKLQREDSQIHAELFRVQLLFLLGLLDSPLHVCRTLGEDITDVLVPL